MSPAKSHLEEIVLNRITLSGLPLPEREYRFDDKRRFRFDFAWKKPKIALEVEGGIYVYGRHNRPKGMTNDARKYNLAAKQGWRVLRYTKDMVDEVIGDLMDIDLLTQVIL